MSRQRVRPHQKLLFWVVGFLASLAAPNELRSFAPRDFAVFSNNLVRLVENHQHFYCKAYYGKYHQLFSSEEGFSSLTIFLVKNLPYASLKESIFRDYHSSLPKGAAADERIALLQGWHSLHKGDLEGAALHFDKIKPPLKWFYLGYVDLQRGNRQGAIRRLSAFCKQSKNKKHRLRLARAYLYLAELHYEEGNYELALESIRKSKLRSVDRTILLYRVYVAMGRETKAESVLLYIRENYSRTFKGMNFLEKHR